jgi:carotenoid cleavage dioxygenase-like enzyme
MNLLVLGISIIYIITCSGYLIKNPFGKRFSIANEEIRKQIEYNLPSNKQKVLNKINGVYAIIGPDVHIKNVSTLFDLFIGDGVIQSVFFDNGNLTYVKHYVRTEKLLYEEEYGKLSKKVLPQLVFTLLNKLKLLPNIMGLANTAILNINNKHFALYERDMPYLINFDFKTKQIHTIKKMNIPFMNYFSAHSKCEKTINTIEYNMMSNSIHYSELTKEFELIKEKTMKMNYLPLVHDFINANDKIIILDSPLVIDFPNLFKKTLPILLDKNKPTIIRILNKSTLVLEEYSIPTGFYIFHFANYEEDEFKIEIYATMYDKLDFSELNISGKYRKIIINKETKTIVIAQNSELEKLDLEFPVSYEDKIVFRSMENKRINGFVVCKDLEIVKKLEFGNKFISGEPAITYVDNVPYLLALAFNDNDNSESYLIIANMHDYSVMEIPINESLNIGFHSIFIEKIE